MTLSGEDREAALRHEIGEAGARARSLRLGCGGAVAALPAAFALGVAVTTASLPWALYLRQLAAMALLLAAAAGLAAASALSVAAGYRRRCRARLGRRLAGLAPAERLAVLGPLREARGDTGWLAAALRAQFSAATAELAPASSPVGGEHEVSAG
jgi:hypothetical protein